MYGQDTDTQPEGVGNPKGKWGGGSWDLLSGKRGHPGLVHTPGHQHCNAVFLRVLYSQFSLVIRK